MTDEYDYCETVRDLIRVLQTLDPDSFVYLQDGNHPHVGSYDMVGERAVRLYDWHGEPRYVGGTFTELNVSEREWRDHGRADCKPTDDEWMEARVINDLIDRGYMSPRLAGFYASYDSTTDEWHESVHKFTIADYHAGLKADGLL